MASFIAPLIGGLAGLFGGGTQQKTQTSGTITNNGSSTSNQSTNPNFSPLQNALISQFTKGASDLFNQSQDLSGYAAGGLKSINSGTNLASKNIANAIASRGLSFSPAGSTAQTQEQLAGAGQQSQFLNSLPLLQRQLQQGALGQLMSAFSAIPTGTTSTGSATNNSTQTQQGTNLVSGNPVAGAISGAGAGLLGPNSSGTGSNLSDILNQFWPKTPSPGNMGAPYPANPYPNG